MDIIYPLGKGSKWNDNELRFSLRSVAQNLDNVGRVVIVGEKPDWLKDVIHIPCEDMPGAPNKEANIMRKIRVACLRKDLTKDLLFLNDDHFIMRKMNAEQFPYYHKGIIGGAMIKRAVSDAYRNSLRNTYEALIKIGATQFHFDIHVPIVYNRSKFVRIMNRFDWAIPYGYVIKSLYANTAKVETEYLQDLKIDRDMNWSQLVDTIRDRDIFSIGDNGLNKTCKELIQILWPNKSPWEI